MITGNDIRLFIVSTPWDDADKYLDKPLTKKDLLGEIVKILTSRLTEDLAYSVVVGERTLDLQEFIEGMMK